MRLVFATVVLVGIAVPAAASADVLVNAIVPGSVACGQVVRPGIWYQSFSGGPRWAQMRITDATGAVVWHKNATATTSWHYWQFRGKCGARYVLTYRTAGGTTRFRFSVRAR